MLIPKCKYCEDAGFVFMREKEAPRYTANLCCICAIGSEQAKIIHTHNRFKYTIAQWNGLKEQVSRGRALVFDTPTRYQDIEYDRKPLPHVDIKPIPNWQN